MESCREGKEVIEVPESWNYGCYSLGHNPILQYIICVGQRVCCLYLEYYTFSFEDDKSSSSHVKLSIKTREPITTITNFSSEAHIKHLGMASKYAVLGLLDMLVIMMLLMSASADFAKDRQECADQLVGLATCLPYVGGEGKSPTLDCCTGLKQVLQKARKCLCILIKDRNDPNLGLKINATLAMGLPSACHAPANISACPGKHTYMNMYEFGFGSVTFNLMCFWTILGWISSAATTSRLTWC